MFVSIRYAYHQRMFSISMMLLFFFFFQLGISTDAVRQSLSDTVKPECPKSCPFIGRFGPGLCVIGWG